MLSPITGKDMIVKKEWRTMIFRKEEFKILFHSWYCVDSGEEFEDDLFANLNYNQVVNQYREKHNIPFPEEIKNLREQYKLPAIRMSQVLGLGDNTYRQYEAGEMPTPANARLIQMAADPNKFLEMLLLSDLQNDKQFATARSNAEKLIKQKDLQENVILNCFFGKRNRSRFSGYSMPNFQKFTEMILYFSSEKDVWKTKLNKMLFYADFANYKYHNRSISGAKYCPIDMGPVPDNFNILFEILVNEKVLDVSYQSFSDGGIGEKYTPLRGFDESLFTPDELEIMQNVKVRLTNISTQDVIEMSHQEKAWSENRTNKSQPIDYTYAYELGLF
jgi:transcriptional regulator with XRE-family HTH domain